MTRNGQQHQSSLRMCSSAILNKIIWIISCGQEKTNVRSNDFLVALNTFWCGPGLRFPLLTTHCSHPENIIMLFICIFELWDIKILILIYFSRLHSLKLSITIILAYGNKIPLKEIRFKDGVWNLRSSHYLQKYTLTWLGKNDMLKGITSKCNILSNTASSSHSRNQCGIFEAPLTEALRISYTNYSKAIRYDCVRLHRTHQML